MDDFLTAFNNKKQDEAESGTIVRPFISCPTLLPLAERQELVYRFQYLEESIEALALHYRLSPKKVEEYIEEQDIERIALKTEEDIIQFEEHVNALYKSLQVRLIGLTALNTAKTWQSLATAEEDLLASLNNATKAVMAQERPDPKTLSSLVGTHAKIADRHDLIQKGMAAAGDVVGALKEQLGWEIEVTHVENMPKTRVSKDDDDEDNEDNEDNTNEVIDDE